MFTNILFNILIQYLNITNIIKILPLSMLNLGIIPTSFLSTFEQVYIIAFIAIISLIIIAAIIYALSGILDSPNMRAWSRLQIYQAIVAGALLAFFVAILTLTYINPSQVLSSSNLLPPKCSSVTDIYQAATCDLSVFNNDAWNYTSAVGGIALLLSSTGGVAVNIPLTQTISFGFVNEDILPIGLESILTTLLQSLSLFFIISNILILLLAGAVFWFISFVTLGLVARAFGVTRSFGGSMVALGVGLGVVLPILVIIMYGFITTQLGNVDPLTVSGEIIGLALFLISFVGFNGYTFLPGNILFDFAALFSGMILIPFLIFTVLDAFIIDFSSAIGERIDFMSMLTGLL
ncbi:MAG: hypothetical protein ACP5RQ_02105 [Candidatus Micrarchaeia archaeon]